jgi:hypothetical protein
MLKALVQEFFAMNRERLEEAVNAFLSNWNKKHGSRKQIISITAHTTDEVHRITYTFFYLEKSE